MQEIKYLNDKVIKKALAKENKDIRNYIARIISDITRIPYEVLENNLELVYPEVGYNSHLVNSEVDLVFKNEVLYFNFEINYGSSTTLKIKNLSYVFQLSLRQIKKWSDYAFINPVIQININSYDPYGYGDFLYESQMMVKKYHIVHNKQITIFDINLAYFKKIDYNEIKKESLLKDLAFLVIEDERFLNKLYEGDKIMDSVQREMKGLMEEVDGILYYDEVKLQKAIEKEMAEKGLQEGLERGLQEGLQKGMKQGLEQGIKQGLKQANKDMAINLLKMNILTLEQIAEATTLSIQEVKEIKIEMQNN